MWDLPGPGFEPVSLALAGGFLTTEPRGKPLTLYLEVEISWKAGEVNFPSFQLNKHLLKIYTVSGFV